MSDAERLDWLETCRGNGWLILNGAGTWFLFNVKLEVDVLASSLRQAIDEAQDHEAAATGN